MQLQECILKHILSSAALAYKSKQKMEQLALIPANELRERSGITGPVAQKQLFVGRIRRRFRLGFGLDGRLAHPVCGQTRYSGYTIAQSYARRIPKTARQLFRAHAR